MKCVFCQIVQGEIQSYKVYEDKITYAFLDLYPVADGHVLVIPKRHFADWSSCPPDVLSQVALTAQKVRHLIAQKLKPSGFNYVSNEKAIAYQVIFHFHIHVIPKYKAREGYLMSKNPACARTVKKVFAQIKSH